MDINKSILKDCPFCGERAIQGEIRDWLLFGKKSFYIECKECYGTSGFFKTKEEAIMAWNNREDDND